MEEHSYSFDCQALNDYVEREKANSISLSAERTAERDAKAEKIKATRLYLSAIEPIKYSVWQIGRDGELNGFLQAAGLSVISGQAGSKKSTFLACVAGDILASDTGQRLYAPNSELYPNGLNILWIDTEQLPGNAGAIMRTIYERSGLTEECFNERLCMLLWRGFSSEERRERLTDAIELYKPDIIIVDGIADMMQDAATSAEEATHIRDMLLTITNDRECNIIVVQHTNEGEESDKARGHIGAELTRKADMRIVMRKPDYLIQDDGTRVARCIKFRSNRPLEDIYVTYQEGKPYLSYSAGQQPIQLPISVETVREWFGRTERYTAGQLNILVMQETGKKERTAYNYMEQLVAAGVLVKNGNGKANTYYTLQADDCSNSG